MANMRQEITNQVLHASPSIIGAVLTGLMGITLNQVFVTTSIVFVSLQAIYLLWKWRNEYRDRNEKH